LTNLQGFFNDLKNNLEVIEAKNLTPNQIKLLEGQNIQANLRREYVDEYSPPGRPTGTAAFLHAIRTYRPSNKIRALVKYRENSNSSMIPKYSHQDR
jgi:hypothetical protein